MQSRSAVESNRGVFCHQESLAMDASSLSRRRARQFSLILGLACLLTLSGCLSTSLIDRWKDPAFSGPPLHKMLVVGVQKDDGRRRLWEVGVAAALTLQRVQATASYMVFPNRAPSAHELARTASRE